MPRNVLLDPSVDLFALTVSSAWMYVLAGWQLACASRVSSAAVRCVLCLDVLCLYVSVRPLTFRLSMFTWILMFVVARLAAGPRSLRGDTVGLVRTCIPSDMGIRTSRNVSGNAWAALLAASGGSPAESLLGR